ASRTSGTELGLSLTPSVYQPDRFDLLSEYLSRSGMSENPPPSTVLPDHVKDMLSQYENELDCYIENVQRVEDSDHSIISWPPTQSIQEQEPIRAAEAGSDEMEHSLEDFLLDMNKHGSCNVVNVDQLQMQLNTVQLLPRISSVLQRKIDKLVEST